MTSVAPTDPRSIWGQLWNFPVSHVELGFDVGANMGQSLNDMARLCDRVVAYEPADECFDSLIEQAGDRVIILDQSAVSDKIGSLELYAFPLKIAKGELATGPMLEWAHQHGQTRVVHSTTIDTEAAIYGPPGLIKVDVEGHEAKVLDGAAHTLEHAHPQWLIEIHSEVLGAYCSTVLTDNGYIIEEVRHPYYDADSSFWFDHYWIKAY